MDDITPRFNDLGQRDQRDEEAKTWAERDREIERLQRITHSTQHIEPAWPTGPCQEDVRLDVRRLDAQPELRQLFSLLEDPLIRRTRERARLGKPFSYTGKN